MILTITAMYFPRRNKASSLHDGDRLFSLRKEFNFYAYVIYMNLHLYRDKPGQKYFFEHPSEFCHSHSYFPFNAA
jgi:hypothetical protein